MPTRFCIAVVVVVVAVVVAVAVYQQNNQKGIAVVDDFHPF